MFCFVSVNSKFLLSKHTTFRTFTLNEHSYENGTWSSLNIKHSHKRDSLKRTGPAHPLKKGIHIKGTISGEQYLLSVFIPYIQYRTFAREQDLPIR